MKKLILTLSALTVLGLTFALAGCSGKAEPKIIENDDGSISIKKQTVLKTLPL